MIRAFSIQLQQKGWIIFNLKFHLWTKCSLKEMCHQDSGILSIYYFALNHLFKLESWTFKNGIIEKLIILLKTEIEYTYILIYITLSYICVELKFQALQLPLRNNICNIENIIVYLYFVYHHNLQYYNFSRSSTTNRSKREKNDISDDSYVFKTKLIIMKLQKFQW